MTIAKATPTYYQFQLMPAKHVQIIAVPTFTGSILTLGKSDQFRSIDCK